MANIPADGSEVATKLKEWFKTIGIQIEEKVPEKKDEEIVLLLMRPKAIPDIGKTNCIIQAHRKCVRMLHTVQVLPDHAKVVNDNPDRQTIFIGELLKIYLQKDFIPQFHLSGEGKLNWSIVDDLPFDNLSMSSAIRSFNNVGNAVNLTKFLFATIIMQGGVEGGFDARDFKPV